MSHDRYFLDRVVTKIVHLHDGRAEQHLGNYSDWKAREQEDSRRGREAPKRSRTRSPIAKTEPTQSTSARQKKAQERGSGEEAEAAAELETKIAGAESEIAALNDKLAADHGGDWTSCTRSSPTRKRSSSG